MSCNVMGHNVNMLTRVMTGVSQDLQLNLKKKKKKTFLCRRQIISM